MEATMMALPNVIAKAQISEGSLTLLPFRDSSLSSLSPEGQVLVGNVLEFCSLNENLLSDAKWILHV